MEVCDLHLKRERLERKLTMPYQYRWLYAGVFGVILVLMAYVYDLHPLLVQLDLLHQSEITLNEKMTAIKLQLPAVQSNMPVSHENNGLNWLMSFAERSGLTIQTVNLSSSGKEFHILFKGNYQQWAGLLNQLEQNVNTITLKNVSCKWTEQNNLLIASDVLFADETHLQMMTHSNIANALHNPFCETSHEWKSEVNEALLSPINQIKMVGYLQLGSQSEALFLLPNKKVSMVKAGFLLGMERGVVLAIYRDRALVRLPNGKTVTLNFAANLT